MRKSIYLLLMFSMAFTSAQQEPENMKGMVDRHNFWRKKVNVPDLSWSPELSAFAQAWADKLAAEGCNMEHRPRSGKWGSSYGENIYWSSGMKNTPDVVVDNWASEIQNFDAKKGSCKGSVCGHYTQVVWRNTQRVGCGMAKCGDQEIWVCNYDPPGNWVGEKPY